MTPTFVINLDRDAERMLAIGGSLIREGIEFHRVPAVLGHNVPQMWGRLFKGSRLSPGEVGCYASHLLACRRVVSGLLPFALVLEDDAQIPQGFAAILAQIVSGLPKQWDIVKLCNNPKRAAYSVGRVGDRHLVRFSRAPGQASAYLISLSGARKMLAPSCVRNRAIDIEMAQPWHFGLDVYGVCPAPVPAAKIMGSSITVRSRPEKGLAHKLRAARHALSTIGMRGIVACRMAELAGRRIAF